MRALVVGGGCRGLALARALAEEGHAVRIVTRDARRRGEIEAAGAECWPGTPDVVGTLRYALDNVTVLLWLLGTATGPPEELAALHGPRLRMLLDKTTDTTVRGVVIETAGSVDAAILAAATVEARRAWATNEIPFALLDADPGRPDRWLPAARAAIEEVLTARRSAAA